MGGGNHGNTVKIVENNFINAFHFARIMSIMNILLGTCADMFLTRAMQFWNRVNLIFK